MIPHSLTDFVSVITMKMMLWEPEFSCKTKNLNCWLGLAFCRRLPPIFKTRTLIRVLKGIEHHKEFTTFFRRVKLLLDGSRTWCGSDTPTTTLAISTVSSFFEIQLTSIWRARPLSCFECESRPTLWRKIGRVHHSSLVAGKPPVRNSTQSELLHRSHHRHRTHIQQRETASIRSQKSMMMDNKTQCAGGKKSRQHLVWSWPLPSCVFRSNIISASYHLSVTPVPFVWFRVLFVCVICVVLVLWIRITTCWLPDSIDIISVTSTISHSLCYSADPEFWSSIFNSSINITSHLTGEKPHQRRI